MPWAKGKPRSGYKPGLSNEEEQMIEQAYLVEGITEGVHALFHRLRDRHGDDAPSRDDIAEWLSKRPEAQISRMPRADRAIAPFIAPPVPMSRTCFDTMFLPPAAHKVRTRTHVYRCLVVYQCAFTKFVHLHPVHQLDDNRPVSEQTLRGMQEFIKRARIAARDDSLHPEVLVSDKGSEALKSFEEWRAEQAAAHPGFYQSTKTPGTRSSFNPVERTVQQIRRLMQGRYRSWRLAQDMADVPQAQRAFDWVQHVEDTIDTYNTRYHSTIKSTPQKAINPTVEPSYKEVHERIRRVAKKTYGGRVDGASIPGYSKRGLLAVGQLLRRKIHKDGGSVAQLKWNKVEGKTSDDNFSRDLFRIRTVHQGEGLRVTSYSLEDMDGNSIPGKWSRTQLLPVPEETLQYVSESEEETDDEPDDEPEDDSVPTEPRPIQSSDYRYKKGDKLLFKAAFFADGDFPDLTAPIVSDRVGTITDRRKRRGLRTYTVQFPEAKVVFARTEVDEDQDVEYAG